MKRTRVSLWLAGILGGLILYFAGAPFVFAIVATKLPSAVPVLGIVYSPAILVAEIQDNAFCDFYEDYCETCMEFTNGLIR